jgi:hypothetical protein
MAVPNNFCTFAVGNNNDMETQVAYTNHLKPVSTPVRKAAKLRQIPEGYMSMDEFSTLFHRKLDEAYAKLHGDSEQ